MREHNLKHKIILSCKKASALIDKRSVMKLSGKEKVSIKVHLSICDACRAYQTQSNVLHTILTNHLSKIAPDQVIQQKNDALKVRITERLTQES